MTIRNPMTEVLEIERGFWNAGGDVEYYRKHFYDDGLMLLPGVPRPMDKEAVLSSVAGAEPWSGFEIEDIAFSEPATFVAVLAYRVSATRASSPKPYRALISSVYLAIGTDWRLLSHQQTPLDL